MKKRMDIQHRYMRFLSHLLGNGPEDTVDFFCVRFAILYSMKHT